MNTLILSLVAATLGLSSAAHALPELDGKVQITCASGKLGLGKHVINAQYFNGSYYAGTQLQVLPILPNANPNKMVLTTIPSAFVSAPIALTDGATYHYKFANSAGGLYAPSYEGDIVVPICTRIVRKNVEIKALHAITPEVGTATDALSGTSSDTIQGKKHNYVGHVTLLR